MKTLRLIMLAVMACAVLTCCTEELTNENGNGGNNNGGTTTPTQYMWPKYKGRAYVDNSYVDDLILTTRTTIDKNEYGVWLSVYMRGRVGDTLIKVEPDPYYYTPLDSVKPFNFRTRVKYKVYIGDSTQFVNALFINSLHIKGDSAIIKAIPSMGSFIIFRGVKCD